LAVDVEDLVLDQAEHGLLNRVLDEVFNGVADILVQFGEKDLCLFVSQGAHLFDFVDYYNKFAV